MAELYNDRLLDLFRNKSDRDKPEVPKLSIKKDSKGMVYVHNITIRKANKLEDLQKYFAIGCEARHTGNNLLTCGNKIDIVLQIIGATLMNEHSSRSHLIFSVIIKAKNSTTQLKTTGKVCKD
jgi:hypothetical protein